MNGQYEISELLLARGGDPAIADPDGQSIADHADAAGHDRVAALLRAVGTTALTRDKDRFRYDAEADTYTCSGDQILRFRGHRPVRAGVRLAIYANRRACKDRALKTRCTNAAGRVVTRYENKAVLKRMADRLAARPEVMDRRRETVEHPIGSIKQWMGQGTFLMRRLENVRAEFSLSTVVYNIRRAITLVGVPALIAAARA